MSTKGNEPAFPESGGQFGFMHGLTKREYIAAKVLAGVIAQSGIAGYECYGITPENAAKASVRCADALLAELDKEVKP